MRLSFFFAVLVVATAVMVVPRGLPQPLPEVADVPQRARVLGYSRAEFGSGWAPYGPCTIREALLASLLIDAVLDTPTCTLTGAATFDDPYTGSTLSVSDAIDIDHIFPLSAAWDLGAHRWTPSQRQAFANDPRNLYPVSAAANREKSDQLPSDWMPSHRSSRCWYAQRLAAVAEAYELPLPTADIRTMRRACHHILT